MAPNELPSGAIKYVYTTRSQIGQKKICTQRPDIYLVSVDLEGVFYILNPNPRAQK